MKKELRLSGSGGQGLILAGIIIAESAIISNINAVQSQSYGPEARGGASKSEVILSDEEINFPKVICPDLLLCLTQKSYDQYGKNIKENGILIVDSCVDIGDNININKFYKIPIIKTAKEKIGKEMVANIVALGAIKELTQIISTDNLKNAILARVPQGSENLNMRAFEEGQLLIKNM
ncbi:2-oxoacid:acceptor oxidoreductase family protein [Tepidibacter formicigenes]|uniref:2-oxoglutarate ferredoxin oxidoreductase subunit gamma n=1 Tax=Tepidibacter formicigenes DSM 15518 TaxID=1123349 RepID=A0A1M6M9P7_9FIRM|nr:2-oxoacid:acceptor oxidoreductase family protein [Tepidibacter formicigenes]SHJ80216.1 2-oxoglutarate ferredoxin oxidoreductase subunit gamma [Tepidibacter formicigenes DSM 15518]